MKDEDISMTTKIRKVKTIVFPMVVKAGHLERAPEKKVMPSNYWLIYAYSECCGLEEESTDTRDGLYQ